MAQPVEHLILDVSFSHIFKVLTLSPALALCYVGSLFEILPPPLSLSPSAFPPSLSGKKKKRKEEKDKTLRFTHQSYCVNSEAPGRLHTSSEAHTRCPIPKIVPALLHSVCMKMLPPLKWSYSKVTGLFHLLVCFLRRYWYSFCNKRTFLHPFFSLFSLLLSQ